MVRGTNTEDEGIKGRSFYIEYEGRDIWQLDKVLKTPSWRKFSWQGFWFKSSVGADNDSLEALPRLVRQNTKKVFRQLTLQMMAFLRRLLIFSLLILLPGLTLRAELVERIVAIIDNSIVTKTDLDSYREKLKTGGLVDDAILKLSDPKELMSNNEALVNHLIDERVIDSEIRRLGMAVTIEKVEQEIRSVTGRNGITREQLKEALKQRGVKFSDYQDFIRTSLERQALIDREVSSRIKISDEDISNFYLTQNMGSDSQIFEYRLAHILIRKVSRGGKSALERVQIVQKKIGESQKSFSELASQFSEDPNFSQGGLLGSFKAGEMLPAIEKGITGLEIGDISPPVETPAGIHLFKVLKKTLVADPKLLEQRAKIQNILYARAFKDQFRKWLDQKREDSFIRINKK